MGWSRAGSVALVVLTAALAATGCGQGSSSSSTPSAHPATTAPAAAGPAGAMVDFLTAANHQDHTRVTASLATATDVTNLDELLRVYAGFGSAGGLYWDVARLTVSRVVAAGNGRADVTLSGDIAWCLGKAASDPAATCSVVNPVAGMAHTYVVVDVDGQWKADVDVNASSGIDHNPQASPTAAAPTVSPTP